MASIVFLLDSIGIEQWFSTKGDIAPRGYLAMSGDNFACHNWGGATDISQVKAKDVTMHRIAPQQIIT